MTGLWPDPEWRVSDMPVSYPEAVAVMEDRVRAIQIQEAPELVWFLEHPSLYTAGTSAKEEDLLMPDGFPVYCSGRGGQYTYHGPGQRIGYLMFDLSRRTCDVRGYVHAVEEWLILALARCGVVGERRTDRVGIWVRRGSGAESREDKIAAIGVRIRKWITLHGFSLNINPNLDHFRGIVPCGIRDHGVTSLSDLQLPVTMTQMDEHLRVSYAEVFGRDAPGSMRLHRRLCD